MTKEQLRSGMQRVTLLNGAAADDSGYGTDKIKFPKEFLQEAGKRKSAGWPLSEKMGGAVKWIGVDHRIIMERGGKRWVMNLPVSLLGTN